MTRRLGATGPEVSALGLEGPPPVDLIVGADVFEAQAAVIDDGSHSLLLKT